MGDFWELTGSKPGKNPEKQVCHFSLCHRNGLAKNLSIMLSTIKCEQGNQDNDLPALPNPEAVLGPRQTAILLRGEVECFLQPARAEKKGRERT